MSNPGDGSPNRSARPADSLAAARAAILTVSGCPCPGWADLSAGSAGCWGRNCGRPLQECLRGPARERDGVVPRQAGDVDEPDDGLDADGGTDAEHELTELLVGQVTVDAVERLGDPGDRASLAKGQRVSFGGIG